MPLLDAKFLKQITRLQIRSENVFRGKFKGERRSLNRGASVEFADYRTYELGDDLRYIDWNVYARLDRLFLKLFNAEDLRHIENVYARLDRLFLKLFNQKRTSQSSS